MPRAWTPIIIGAFITAICSGAVLLAVVGWGRADAVRAATLEVHARRLDAIEQDRRIDSRDVIILKEDVKHVLRNLEEIKTSLDKAK